MQKVAVVILNYNGKHWLEKFLPNVIQHSTYPNTEIIIADNASTDDSIEFLAAKFPNIKIVSNKINTGYAGGYHDALQHIESDFYVLLNSDVEVTPNWIEHVIYYMQQDETIAACQPKILSHSDKNKFEYAGAAGGFIDKYGFPFCRGRIFETCETDVGQYNSNIEIFWASGACLFIRAKLYHAVGGLDSDFFAHMEEIDLCWRLKNIGYKIYYCADSIVYHVGGGTLNKSNPQKTFLNFRNNRILLHKNLSSNELHSIAFIRNMLDGIAWLKACLTLNFKEANAIKNAIKAYYKNKPKWDKKRNEIEQQFTTKIPNKTGILNDSIVWLYFIKGLKKFNQIKW